jgi:hypothetical protein
MFPISEVRRVYDETVCKGQRVTRASLYGKAVLGLADSPDDVKIVARTIHQMGEVVCVGRNVFRIQKGHHIEMVVGVRSLAVNAVVMRLAALYMEKVRRVAPLPEG